MLSKYFGAVVLLISISVGSYYIGILSAPAPVSLPPVVHQVQEMPRSTEPASSAVEINNAPAGIALPINSLVSPEAEDTVKEIVSRIEDAPALISVSSGLTQTENRRTTALHNISTEDEEVLGAQEDQPDETRETFSKKNQTNSIAINDDPMANDTYDGYSFEAKIAALEQRASIIGLENLKSMAIMASHKAAINASQARVYALNDNIIDALSAWQRALHIDPDNEDYVLGLAILHDRMGKEEDALRLYRQVSFPLPEPARRRMDYLAKAGSMRENLSEED